MVPSRRSRLTFEALAKLVGEGGQTTFFQTLEKYRKPRRSRFPTLGETHADSKVWNLCVGALRPNSYPRANELALSGKGNAVESNFAVRPQPNLLETPFFMESDLKRKLTSE